MDFQHGQEGMIGISIRHKKLRMTEAVSQTGEYRISRVAHGALEVPFSLTMVEDRSNIETIARSINSIYNASGFTADRAALSLDSSMVLIKKIPVDATFSGEELQEHVRWEVSQFMINPLESFIIDFEKTEANGQAPAEQNVIVVTIRKSVIDFIREIFAATNLHLRAIDVDVFAAHRVLANTFEFSPDNKIALVDLREADVQFSMIYHGFYLSQEVPYPTDDIVDPSIPPEQQTARMISKEVRRIILDNKLGKGVEELHKVFIYGEGVKDKIIEYLSEDHNVSFHRINPFEKIQLLESQPEAEVSKHPEAFVTSVGVAIKGV